MYKAFSSSLPPNIQSLFEISNITFGTRRNNGLCFKLKPLSNKIQNGRPSIIGPRIWNELPTNLKVCTSLGNFKNALKSSVIHY